MSISRINEPIPDMFGLCWMHFSWWHSKYGHELPKVDSFFEKVMKFVCVVCPPLAHGSCYGTLWSNIHQAWEWISVKKKENCQIPLKQAENEWICQIWETNKKRNSCLNRKILMPDTRTFKINGMTCMATYNSRLWRDENPSEYDRKRKKLVREKKKKKHMDIWLVVAASWYKQRVEFGNLIPGKSLLEGNLCNFERKLII